MIFAKVHSRNAKSLMSSAWFGGFGGTPQAFETKISTPPKKKKKKKKKVFSALFNMIPDCYRPTKETLVLIILISDFFFLLGDACLHETCPLPQTLPCCPLPIIRMRGRIAL